MLVLFDHKAAFPLFPREAPRIQPADHTVITAGKGPGITDRDV